ncbi:MAG: response regulator [Candidatus Viridilinea halotolerans]|uniref:Response regulator n=1 Tax=Candidatus Viridilinea halotolerans TaxID=2491704 RepID=A0A426UBA3_9CHLR|nr:MAG: response regulator [Candidatus Viridilinea halotolerans]
MPTVLVVDDYAPNNRLLEFVLEQSGFAVIIASDGMHALSTLRDVPVDIVVTDLRMPRLNGLDLVQQLRADGQLCTLPIVMITASGRDSDATRATGLGVDAFLTRPVDSDDLVAVVRQLMTREASAEGSQLRECRRQAATRPGGGGNFMHSW